MIKVLTACIVVLVLTMHLSTQVVANTLVTTTTSANSTAAKGEGFTVLPSVLSLILPTGLLASLLQNLHC